MIGVYLNVLGRQFNRSTEIPLIVVIIMLLTAILLIWYRGKRNLNKQISLSREYVSIIPDKDILGFEKITSDHSVYQNSREIGIVGRALALITAVVVFCTPVYSLLDHLFFYTGA